ncbi:ATP-binding protein [Mucilaginibacter sp.]|uniref:ATP-binding protein n=1 Tax=Mucilaginibacter sp. TaxID=1882438 RepID=UPI0025D7CC37|nr:ATP-binding protein [Mucilaginibacter sp.]
MTIEELKTKRESEDKVEFKAASKDFTYNGGKHTNQADRRKCFLGYVVALSNEGGGMLVLGMGDRYPHEVVGTKFADRELGNLIDSVYGHLKIRVQIDELFENGKRVIVTTIPARPVGKPMKYEGVPLMRIGESLRNMSDEELFKVLSEQEPDYSAKICEGLTIDDLDEAAIDVLKQRYASKQQNQAFRSLSNEQVLSDLDLIKSDKVTYAALILLGKKEALQQYIPQSKVIIEYRSLESEIAHDWREEINEPLFIGIDNVWNIIRSRNTVEHHNLGPYIIDIPVFNEMVIREALLNAIAHRDYRLTSEIVIKQFPKKLIINNPGGFPLGVNLENLLSVNSTPRSRLMADVLLKTGLVERSGQGVDKIYSLTLSEGKAEPDYSNSDPFQVSLVLKGSVTDKAFNVFIQSAQDALSVDQKLSVYDIIGLAKVREGLSSGIHNDVIQKLEKEELIVKVGSGNSQRFVLGNTYQELTKQPLKIGNYIVKELEIILETFKKEDKVKMGTFVNSFEGGLKREQVKFLVEKLLDDKVLEKSGEGAATKYTISSKFNGKSPFSQVEEFLNHKYKPNDLDK